jgi:hypothetical protein
MLPFPAREDISPSGAKGVPVGWRHPAISSHPGC